MLTHVKSDAKIDSIDGSNDRIDGSIDRINCYSCTAVYTRVLNLVSSMYTAALIKSASRFTQCMAPAWRARAGFRIFLP